MTYDAIRPDIKDSLDNWAEKGWPPGGFLHAVLTNDLSNTVARADSDNLFAIGAIVIYVYNELPAACWGSEEKVVAWGRRFDEAATK